MGGREANGEGVRQIGVKGEDRGRRERNEKEKMREKK